MKGYRLFLLENKLRMDFHILRYMVFYLMEHIRYLEIFFFNH